MKAIAILPLLAGLLCAFSLGGSPGFAAEPPGGDGANGNAKVTILYDAFGEPSSLKKDWGFSALIEYRGKRILFDTGNNGEIFAHNVKEKGVDLTNLDFAVVSHRHGDHTSGLSHLLSVNPDVAIYVPQENFSVFGAALPSTFYKKNPSLPEKKRYFGGNPPETMRFGSAWPKGNFTWVRENIEVAPGIHLIVLTGKWGADFELRELSLVLETPDGPILVVGCGHPRIEAIVEETGKVVDRPIHLIMGGLHLLPASTEEITRIADALHDRSKVAFIAPGHCTGERGFAILEAVFADRYVYAGLGTTLEIGPDVSVRADARTRPAMRRADLKAYRQALAMGPYRALLGRGKMTRVAPKGMASAAIRSVR